MSTKKGRQGNRQLATVFFYRIREYPVAKFRGLLFLVLTVSPTQTSYVGRVFTKRTVSLYSFYTTDLTTVRHATFYGRFQSNNAVGTTIRAATTRGEDINDVSSYIGTRFYGVISSGLWQRRTCLPFIQSRSLSSRVSVGISRALLSVFSTLRHSYGCATVGNGCVYFPSMLFCTVVLLLSGQGPTAKKNRHCERFGCLCRRYYNEYCLPSRLRVIERA